MKKLNVGLVGYGYWGPNLARNISETADVELSFIAERDPARRNLAVKKHSRTKCVSHYRDFILNSSIDAVVIATPAHTHLEIARTALERGKHVWVEKPLAPSAGEAEELCDVAKKVKKVLLVDHTFVYTPAVQKMREIVASKKLGEIYYFDSIRINLGLFYPDVNVIWDLAPHDLSILQFVLNKKVKSVLATGQSFARNHKENIAYISLELEDRILAHIHVNWLSPIKVRSTIIGGSRRMLVYDDLNPDEKIRIYDRGVKDFSKDGFYRSMVKYRTGDTYAPYIERKEALKIEAEHFIECIRKNKRPMTDGEVGLEVVRTLEAIDRSLSQGGARVEL